ncbi:hypothetical protein Save01_08974 [Streptomyces avermitilis]|uniref:Uncharacterized protein n=1 Tax=Streptomyces avermitilis (strain ATCC 31267 / DSM 46492 / JCM 5070 / NBRC 14893 / NCIMB 12804 / NRRL 8165 / MA-4680) TaxID=227882 RepID=Q825A3_STRAW|nr:hypothetical protein SAVERM_7557 [Streptomyces avermitilis MA-4680 = NBRC 14893]BAU77682.1 hypothetical protein SAVERM_2p243 [Streptomyces avermitilis MA-4680 = NBRC 14893]
MASISYCDEPKRDSCHIGGMLSPPAGAVHIVPGFKHSSPVASSTLKYVSHTQARAKGLTPSGRCEPGPKPVAISERFQRGH